MEKNVTLRLDENILKLCKFKAVEENKSLSKWLADLMQKEAGVFLLSESKEYKKAKEKALKLLSKGYNLGGKPLKREEIYERKIIR
jgi:predicted HAD superfamily phosphohydrolase YqeG